MKYKNPLLAAFVLMGAIVLTSFKGDQEKKLNLSLTVKEAQTILQALTECDCGTKTSESIRQAIVAEYNRVYPQPRPEVKKDSTNKKQ